MRALKSIPGIWEITDLCNRMLVLQAEIENKKVFLEAGMKVLMAG
jgi:hypothetical protein